MGIEFQCGRGATERRRAERSRREVVGTVRERARSACAATFEGISVYGCRIHSHSLLLKGNAIWVRLPGLNSLVGHITWAEDSRCGVAFDTPLHPAVAARFMAGDDTGDNPGAAARVDMAEMADPLLSRREQIIQGMIDCELSPLKVRKNRKATGLEGMISRQIRRQAEHRYEERFSATTAIAAATLTLQGHEAAIENVSASGLKVSTNLTPATIGEEIPVEFDGFEPIPGRVVWMGQGKLGLSLPADSIELSAN